MAAISVCLVIVPHWWRDHSTSLPSIVQLFDSNKQPLHHLSASLVCVREPWESCHPHFSLFVFLVHQHHNCQRVDRQFDRLPERHTGKSRSWWTIRGADSSAKWAATLTWILITVVTIRKESTETTYCDFPTWLLEMPMARLCMVESISLNPALNNSSNIIM